jgi:hypothetical protein
MTGQRQRSGHAIADGSISGYPPFGTGGWEAGGMWGVRGEGEVPSAGRRLNVCATSL